MIFKHYFANIINYELREMYLINKIDRNMKEQIYNILI